jgi:hypothetical protein
LVCNSYRIIVIECAVNIVKPRSIIAEWLEITCCSGGCTTPVKPRQPLSNYRILRVWRLPYLELCISLFWSFKCIIYEQH